MREWSTATGCCSFKSHHHVLRTSLTPTLSLTYFFASICKESLVSTANFRDPVSSTHPPHQSLWFAWRASWWDVSTRMPCRSPQALPLTHPTLVPSPHRLSHHILHVTVIVCDLLHDLARSVYNNSHSLIWHRRLPSHRNEVHSHAIRSKVISHVDLLIRKFGLP